MTAADEADHPSTAVDTPQGSWEASSVAGRPSAPADRRNRRSPDVPRRPAARERLDRPGKSARVQIHLRHPLLRDATEHLPHLSRVDQVRRRWPLEFDRQVLVGQHASRQWLAYVEAGGHIPRQSQRAVGCLPRRSGLDAERQVRASAFGVDRTTTAGSTFTISTAWSLSCARSF
jgi:hypothetical protein